MINMVPLTNIEVRKRVRIGGPKPAKVQEMLDDIRSPTGLLQPGMASLQDAKWVLTIGETRLRAFERHWSESSAPIKFGTTVVPFGCMPLLDIDSVDPIVLLRAEINENVIRTDLTWQEKSDALASLYAMEPTGTPISATAKRLADSTGKSQSHIQQAIARSLIVSDNLHDPEVRKATSQREAWNIVKRKSVATLREASAQAKILEAAEPSGPKELHHLYNDTCENFFASYDGPSFDLVLCDPPYGNDADKWTFKSVTNRHKYNDSMDYAMGIYKLIAEEGLRLCKPRANFFAFCSADVWHLVADIVEAAGWAVWPRPLIWVKSNEGMRPWGQMGFGYGYECICFATKGEKGLIQTSMDVITQYKPKHRFHAAQKPDELYARLMELSSIPGDLVLDPTCGSGTVFRAATLQGLTAVGVEKDEEMANLASVYTSGRLDTNLDGGEGAEPDSVVSFDLAGL